mmetsp:Transcript_26002/g.82574  ORF Transcript_26002/g.82574 Transcript_26002/m.82574 type:complete len:206 (+) Transcript_26002:1966-2583(+)
MRTHELESRVGSLPVPEQGEDVEEELDDVDVQHHGPEDVVVHAEGVPAPADDQLRVEDQVEGEDEDAQAAVDLLQEGAAQEDQEEAEDAEHHRGRQEVGTKVREVRLRREGVGRERPDQHARGRHRDGHRAHRVLGAAHAHEEALRRGEAGQQEVVEGEGAHVPLAAAGAHHREHEEGIEHHRDDDQREAVNLDPGLGGLAEDEG